MLRNKSQIAKICGVSRIKVEVCIEVLKLDAYAKISKIPYYNENQFNKIVEILQPEYLTFESKINDK
jgi:hypothetical protein